MIAMHIGLYERISTEIKGLLGFKPPVYERLGSLQRELFSGRLTKKQVFSTIMRDRGLKKLYLSSNGGKISLEPVRINGKRFEPCNKVIGYKDLLRRCSRPNQFMVYRLDREPNLFTDLLDQHPYLNDGFRATTKQVENLYVEFSGIFRYAGTEEAHRSIMDRLDSIAPGNDGERVGKLTANALTIESRLIERARLGFDELPKNVQEDIAASSLEQQVTLLLENGVFPDYKCYNGIISFRKANKKRQHYLDYIKREIDVESSSDYMKEIDSTADKIIGSDPKLLNRKKELIAALLYNNFLSGSYNEHTAPKKDGKAKQYNNMKRLSKITNFSSSKVRYWVNKVKESDIRRFLDYKTGKGLLVYNDLLRLNRIDPSQNIVYEIITSKNKGEANKEIAEKYGLYSARVVDTVIRNHKRSNVIEVDFRYMDRMEDRAIAAS